MNNKKKQENLEEIILENENQGGSNFGNKSDHKLKSKIKELKVEKKEYLDGWQRCQADMVNLKKQHAEEKKLFTSLGKEALLLEIFPVLDNFEAAFSNQEAWEKVDQNWRTGIEYIYQQFQQVLEDNGIKQIGKVGEKFETELHTALENVSTEDEAKNHTIAEITQPGYKLGDKIIREAKVKVFELKK